MVHVQLCQPTIPAPDLVFKASPFQFINHANLNIICALLLLLFRNPYIAFKSCLKLCSALMGWKLQFSFLLEVENLG